MMASVGSLLAACSLTRAVPVLFEQPHARLTPACLPAAGAALAPNLLAPCSAGVNQYETEQRPRYVSNTDLASRVGGLNPRWNGDASAAATDAGFARAVELTGREFEDAVDYTAHVCARLSAAVAGWMPPQARLWVAGSSAAALQQAPMLAEVQTRVSTSAGSDGAAPSFTQISTAPSCALSNLIFPWRCWRTGACGCCGDLFAGPSQPARTA